MFAKAGASIRKWSRKSITASWSGFFGGGDFEGEQWIPIDVEKEDKTVFGFIHRSRLKPLSQFQRIPVAIQTEDKNRLVLESENLKVRIEVSRIAFDSEKAKALRDADRQIWGTDGGGAKFRYGQVSVTIDGESASVPENELEDLAQVNLQSPWTAAWFDAATETLYVEALNSDGAGAYGVVFRFVKGEFQDRKVAIPF